MTSYTTSQAVSQGIQGSFMSMAMTFFMESLAHMIPWLFVMFAVIICDLICGIRRCLKEGTKVRFSRALRDTMGKMVTYASFVIMVALMNTAAGGEYGIDKWACLFVCFIEMCSIFSNILKPHGYNLDFAGLIHIMFKKITPDLSSEDWHDAIKKDEQNEDSH